MFTSQQFGVINMILGASLRCVRVSHYDTQKIAYNMAPLIARDYEVVRNLDFEDYEGIRSRHGHHGVTS